MLNLKILNGYHLDEIGKISEEVESKQPFKSKNFTKIENDAFFDLIKELNDRIETNEKFGRAHADKSLNVYVYLLSVRHNHRKNSSIDKRLNGAVLKTREEMAIELGWMEKGDDSRNATKLLKTCIDALIDIGYVKTVKIKVGYYNFDIVFPSSTKLK